MKPTEDIELLELLLVEMDPPADSFVGILLEVHRQGDLYDLLEMAPSTGNRASLVSLRDRELIYAVLARDLGGSSPILPYRLAVCS